MAANDLYLPNQNALLARRGELSQDALAGKSGVSVSTIRRMEGGTPVSLGSFGKLADYYGCDVSELHLGPAPAHSGDDGDQLAHKPIAANKPTKRVAWSLSGKKLIATFSAIACVFVVAWALSRGTDASFERYNARGQWSINATDIKVDDDFNYEPKQLKLQVVVRQDGRKLWAHGVDSDGDPVKVLEAEFSEDWKFISGRHEIRGDNGRIYLHGVFFAEYMNSGDRMAGYYLQTGTSHGTHVVFGRLEITRDKNAPDEAALSKKAGGAFAFVR